MTLTKGMKIKQTKVNENEMFKNTTANSTLVYEVVRVNKKTYELRKEMGDGIFFRMLQSYYKIGYMKEVTTKDFISLIKVYDDSEEINEICGNVFIPFNSL